MKRNPPRTSRRRRALGQHFLADARVAERHLAYAELEPHDTVLEIGPGQGVLTKRLAPRVARLVAVEKDAALARRLRAEWAPDPRVTILHADATRLDYATLGPFTKVVANLPYSVSTPITFRLLPTPWRSAVLMYQEEFARRLAADCGDAAYGRLSAARAYYATAEHLETVPPGAFRPPPRVSSGLVRLRRHPRPPFPVANEAAYLDLLRIAFSTRRKTLRASLAHRPAAVGLRDADAVDRILAAWGHAAERPEEVPPAEFGRLTRMLAEAQRHA